MELEWPVNNTRAHTHVRTHMHLSCVSCDTLRTLTDLTIWHLGDHVEHEFSYKFSMFQSTVDVINMKKKDFESGYNSGSKH